MRFLVAFSSNGMISQDLEGGQGAGLLELTIMAAATASVSWAEGL